MKKKVLVLFSGGLDSRLVIRFFKEKDFDVTALYFNLPFGCNSSLGEIDSFVKEEDISLKIVDVREEPYLKSYLEVLKKPKFGYGTSFNPCSDCKVWMFKVAKEIYEKEKFDIVASGEVLGQRPMSQTNKKRNLIDGEIGFDILRPLSGKLLPETTYEKKGLIKREEMFDIEGRRRIKQLELAKKWKIKYPNPSGGCLLCERAYKKRFEYLIKKNILNSENLILTKIGRAFLIEDIFYVVARNSYEGEILMKFEKNIILGDKGIPTVYFSKEQGFEKVKELQKVFSKGVSEEKRSEFDKFKL
ncbi:MAG: hypothetical protein WC260_02375 [Candidatus Pacearchaeota archaeon]